jgi:hypothetical protein
VGEDLMAFEIGETVIVGAMKRPLGQRPGHGSHSLVRRSNNARPCGLETPTFKLGDL